MGVRGEEEVVGVVVEEEAEEGVGGRGGGWGGVGWGGGGRRGRRVVFGLRVGVGA